MAIVFNCPHCLFAYRLKDEFGGKQAKCKNPECRQLITIPKAITIPDDGPRLSEAEAEAAALAALNDENPSAPQQQQEQQQQGQQQQGEAAPAEKVIPVTCKFCDHKWTVPWAKAGKNVLCPNPECRRQVKVDEPKEDVPTDWRQAKSKLPTMAKQNYEKLEGVQDAADTKIVTGESLRKADATGEEIEPRPLKQKIMFVLFGLGLIGALGFGGCYLFNRRTAVNEEQLMVEARKELTDTLRDWAKAQNPNAPTAEEKQKAEWVAAEGGLYSAVLNIAGTEYALRHDDAKKTNEAHELFGKAINDLRAAQGPARNMVAAELAFAVLAFGGTDEQAKEQLRIRWEPGTGGGAQPRMNERVRTVHGELRTALGLLAPSEFEFKVSVARRLTRELTKRGHATLAADLIPLALFSDPQKNEARAVIALEIYRIDQGSDVPVKIANDLKGQFPLPPGDTFPASAHALFAVLNVEKRPTVVGLLPTSGEVTDGARFAYTSALLLEGKADEAVKLATRPRAPESQLKALVLCAEWMPDPGPALDAAQAIVAAAKGRKEVPLSPYHVVRLTQIAAEKGRHDQAKTFAESLADEGLRAWAKGEAARLRIVANPKDKAEEAWVELPDAAPSLKAGHAWGRLWIARQNAKLSHKRDEEKKATAAWPQPVHPFALAGIALGLQDK
jgi:hypothetical protein